MLGTKKMAGCMADTMKGLLPANRMQISFCVYPCAEITQKKKNKKKNIWEDCVQNEGRKK